jgi:hypothetical protein
MVHWRGVLCVLRRSSGGGLHGRRARVPFECLTDDWRGTKADQREFRSTRVDSRTGLAM